MKTYLQILQYVPLFLPLITTSVIMSMDAPEQPLSSLIVPTQLSRINFADERQAFNYLTKDDALCLKMLIGKERSGKYNPILQQAEQLLHTVYPTSKSFGHCSVTHQKSKLFPGRIIAHLIREDFTNIDSDETFTKIDSDETKEFVSLIAERALRRLSRRATVIVA